jgi:hypothetical protein
MNLLNCASATHGQEVADHNIADDNNYLIADTEVADDNIADERYFMHLDPISSFPS